MSLRWYGWRLIVINCNRYLDHTNHASAILVGYSLFLWGEDKRHRKTDSFGGLLDVVHPTNFRTLLDEPINFCTFSYLTSFHTLLVTPTIFFLPNSTSPYYVTRPIFMLCCFLTRLIFRVFSFIIPANFRTFFCNPSNFRTSSCMTRSTSALPHA